jgi:peptide/nickel transport system substrate-binding protein
MRFKILVLAVALWMIGTGCRSRQNAGNQVFHYNETTGIASLDPAFAKNQSVMWPVHQLYNTLVETDTGLNIVPSLATHWEVSDDRRLYTFHLRNDVYFHDNDAFAKGQGRLMTAHDIEYSFKRIIDPATASSGAWIFNNRVDSANGFKALDDSTFQLNLIRPFTPILGLLSMQYCSIVPHEVVEKYGKDFRSHPCGTGPFMMQAWEEGLALVLKKHPRYFETDSTGQRLPYLDAIKITFFANKATEFLLFRQGELDFINDIDPSFKDEVLTKKGILRKGWEGKIVLQKHAYLNTEYLGILTDSSKDIVKQSPLHIRQVRQAINYGFDREKMMMYLRNSIGTPALSGFIPSGLPSFNKDIVKGYPYDPAKARQLLTQAGYPEGKGLGTIKLLTIPIYADLASYIAKQMEDIGLNIQVEVVQKSFLLEQTAKSQALFFRGSWIADYPEAENYLSVFYGKNPAPPNYTRYRNPAFDILYERALITENDSLRYDLYRKMDQLIMNDAPVVPLWYDEAIHLVNPKVKGFFPNGLNLLELRSTRIDRLELKRD